MKGRIWISALFVIVLALAGILMGWTFTAQTSLPKSSNLAHQGETAVEATLGGNKSSDTAWTKGDIEDIALIGNENENKNGTSNSLLSQTDGQKLEYPIMTANVSLAVHHSQQKSEISNASLETLFRLNGKFEDSNISMASTMSNPSVASYQIVGKSEVEYEESGGGCLPGKFCNRFGRQCETRVDKLPELAEMTNFSTTLTLQNIKILVFGDSVGMQFFHLLDVATGGNASDRTVLENAFWNHISRGVSSTKKIGAWRTTGMLLPQNENRPPPNEPGGGWNRTMVKMLLNITGEDGHPIGSFDVFIFRIPHGWLQLREITNETIKISLRMAANLFGVKKVILLTLPFNNNVQPNQIGAWLQKNREIFQLASDFEANKTIPGIDRLVVMDMAQFMNSLIEMNVHHLSYLNYSTDMTHLNLRFKERIAKEYQRAKPAAAHVCSGPIVSKRKGLESCDRNMITSDGMHFCLSITGGRFVAATGCLINCLYQPTGFDITGCQQECNNRFMTLHHVG